MLWQRLLFGGLMIAALVGLVVMDGWLSDQVISGERSPTPAAATVRPALPVTLLVVVLVVLGTLEMGRLCRARGYAPATGWAAVIGAGLALIPWIELQQQLHEAPARPAVADAGGLGGGVPPDVLWRRAVRVEDQSPERVQSRGWALPPSSPWAEPTVLWLTIGVFGAFGAILWRKTSQDAVAAMAVTLFIVLYLGLLASFAVRIRCLWPDGRGAAIILYFLLTVKSGDIGAYFAGRSLGRHKLIPWLSPGKTVEGGAGAMVLAGLVAAGGMWAWNLIPALGPAPLSFAQAIVFGLFMAVSGHLGDLMESAIKRDIGTKDSGRVVPAFGGFLDIVDSPLFAGPIAWILLTSWCRVD